MTVVQVDHVNSPSDITPDLLTSILTQHYGTDSFNGEVVSLNCQPLGRGVMSNVQILNVTYASASESSDVQNEFHGSIPNMFLVKFQKPEIPLPDLFSVEGEFYGLVDALEVKSLSNSEDAGGIILSTSSLPFRLLDAIATGKSWLLLQYIQPDRVQTINVTSGCPPDRFDELMTLLARMHACFWIRSEQGESSENVRCHQFSKIARGLSATPGVGHNLPIEDRQASFANSWPAVRKRLLPFFQSESKEYLQQLDGIVKWTAQSPRIKNVANSVGEKKFTLIHGDFHVGNMLFPKLSSHEDKVWCANENTAHNNIINKAAASSRPWLIDWSMSGIGNPLIDLVFFLVVGADVIPSNTHPDRDPIATTSENLEKILRRYHGTLNSSSGNNSQTQNESFLGSESSSLLAHSLLSFDEMVSMFRQCLLNQFIILVCYDDLCRSMAEASPDKESKELLHCHFDRVNVRCVNMLLSEFGWREGITCDGGAATTPPREGHLGRT